MKDDIDYSADAELGLWVCVQGVGWVFQRGSWVRCAWGWRWVPAQEQEAGV